MLSLIKQLFVALFSFSSSLATKCVSLNDEPCMVRPTLIDFSPIELNPFKIILDKCNGSCNALSPKMCALKKTKRINTITNKNEAKTMTKHFHVILNANSTIQHAIQIKNGIMKRVNVKVKIIVSAKKISVGILARVFVRIASN